MTKDQILIVIISAVVSSVVTSFSKPLFERLAQAIMPDATKVIRLAKIFIIFAFRYFTPIGFIIYYCLTMDFSKFFIIAICFQFLILTMQITMDTILYMTRPYSKHIAVTRDIIDTQKQMQSQIQRTAESHIKLVDKIIDAFEGRNNNA